MENITLGQVAGAIAIITPIVGIFWFLFNIYRKIEDTNKLTKVGLGATKVMLDHFIADKVGNGEFKEARKKIDEVLIGNSSR